MRRGFIVPAMLVIAIFMVLCIGLISKQPMRSLGALQSHYQVQARQMAVAGIEEARLRLAGDIDQGFTNTTLSRDVMEPTSNGPVGSYVVMLDATWEPAPYHVLRVESEGFYGSAVKPVARYVIRATLDIKPQPNPNFLYVLRWQESVP